jgi:ectoine hydroxylase-related dioxygenase (phytanoyl-CoA dioxygenase family)
LLFSPHFGEKPVPDSSVPTYQLARRYAADGYVIVRSVLAGEEVEALAREANRLLELRHLIDSNNMRCRWQNHYQTGECRFDTFDPIIDLSPTINRLARDPRLLEIVGSLYGEEACLFKDKLIFKPPGATGYALHQDYIGWASFPKSFLTLLVPIDPADEENGCTEVFPGYHRSGYLSPMDGEYHELPPSSVDESTGVKLALAPGDIAIFSCLTPHRSSPNRSSTWRRQLYLSYNASSEGGDRRDEHYAEFHAWLKKRNARYGKHETYFA